MAPPINDKKGKNRRRKKRRTEDFSSDSDSDSDSSSSHTEKPAAEETSDAEAPSASIDIKDVDIESDEEKEEVQNEPLSREEMDRVRNIKFTSLENQSSAEAKETLLKDKQQLENEYLALMATSFANDIDELRKKPDFADKSVVMLAKALQSGSNMFDQDTLDALLNK